MTETGTAPAAPAPASSRIVFPGHRLASIDLVRGLVMVLMALDHVRDHVHRGAFTYNAADLSQAGAGLFLTRWITHFCAPVFVFLAGTAAFLRGARAHARGDLSLYLLTRGLWLVLLELTLINWEWQMGVNLRFVIGQVIWALGWSMVALAVLVRLPLTAIAFIGGVMIVGHNLFDGVRPESLGGFAPLWRILHVQGPIQYAPGATFLVMYPLVPWIGVMAMGYVFGILYTQRSDERRGAMLTLGALLTGAFVLLRGLNVYGDPMPWSEQRDGLFTLLSFLNCQKYPPSLLFLLMTLGPSLLLLAWLERGVPAVLRPLVVFGRVPLFFYIVHLLLIDVLTVAFAIGQYGKRTSEVFAQGPPPDFGHGLVVVYAVWIGVVLVLYPICSWYAGVKARSRSRLLSYL